MPMQMLTPAINIITQVLTQPYVALAGFLLAVALLSRRQ